MLTSKLLKDNLHKLEHNTLKAFSTLSNDSVQYCCDEQYIKETIEDTSTELYDKDGDETLLTIYYNDEYGFEKQGKLFYVQGAYIGIIDSESELDKILFSDINLIYSKIEVVEELEKLNKH